MRSSENEEFVNSVKWCIERLSCPSNNKGTFLEEKFIRFVVQEFLDFLHQNDFNETLPTDHDICSMPITNFCKTIL